jgi:uncharacterized membrane protein YcaP (DUF421 family)
VLELAISIIRTVILFVLIIVAMRIMGKRQLGELEPAELVVAVLISDLAAQPLQDLGTPLLYGIIPVLTLVGCEILVSGAVIKNIRFRAILCGKPSLIIENGRIIQREMKKNRFTLDELAEELRKKNISDIRTVKHAILETDGSLSTILYADQSPLTPQQAGVEVEEPGYTVMIINDGRVLSENLKRLGYNENWLKKQLCARDVLDSKDVYIMTVDASGRIYFAVKEA